MVDLITCKNEEDPIKNEGTRVFTTLYRNFSDVQGQITLELVVVSGLNLNSSKLSCMSSLRARMRMIESKMKELECSQDFSNYKSMGIFPDAQGQLTPQSLVRFDQISNSSEMLWMSSLPVSMKKIRSKIEALECSQHYTSIFSDAQGQITRQSLVRSGRISNSSEMLWMFSLPACMKKIRPKMKELECSQDFSHYKTMRIFPDAQGPLTPQSLVRSGRILNSSEMLCMSSLPASMKKIRSKMNALECSQHFPHYNPMGVIRCHGHQSSDPIWPKT